MNQVPPEIKQLEHYLNVNGQEMLKLYQKSGKVKEAEELKEKLAKALKAKNQLEKIARLDFSKPSKKIQEIASQYNIDLQDDSIKEEFRRIQQQNIEDIK